jgi:hypothetical protein
MSTKAGMYLSLSIGKTDQEILRETHTSALLVSVRNSRMVHLALKVLAGVMTCADPLTSLDDFLTLYRRHPQACSTVTPVSDKSECMMYHAFQMRMYHSQVAS